MKRIHVAVIGLSLLLPCALFAADNTILGDLTIKPGDSRLVRAAKQTAAWRLSLKVHSTTVIDNYTLRTTGGHFAEANETAASLPGVYSTPAAAGPGAPTGPSPQSRAKMERQIQSLNLEHGVMSDEAGNPWSDQIDEDMVTKRMNEIPGQINQLQNQLNPGSPAMSSPATPPVGNQLPPPPPITNPTTATVNPPQQ